MRRAKLVMNMTSMLDILIILFFAQAIENKDKVDSNIKVCKQGVENLQSEISELKETVTSLEKSNEGLKEDNDRLSKTNKELTAKNIGLAKENTALKSELSQKEKQLEQKINELALKTGELKDKERELESIKENLHIVGEKFNSEKILEELQLNNKDISKEDATRKVIEFIQTQRDLQKQTEKEVSIWIITLSNYLDNRDKKIKLILRLFIRGKEIIAFKEKSAGRPRLWDWENTENLKNQILEALNDKKIVPNTEVQQINIILCFKESDKNLKPNQKSLYTSQIKAFNEVFVDVFLKLQEDYNTVQNPANPNGRGLKTRLIPVPFDPEDLHPLDPDMLIK